MQPDACDPVPVDEGGPAGKHSFDLGDDRTLAYREFGLGDGVPVVYCHGGLMSGLDAVPWHDAASTAGVRIVAPARPGLDGSSPAPGRTTASWVDDVRVLLDHLGIAQTSMLGWSMGGQYAMACAALIPDRVRRAVIIAGALPLTDDTTMRELNAMDTRLTNQSHRHPSIARLRFAVMAQTARHAPRIWAKAMTKDLPPHEADVVHGLADPGLAHAAAVALSSTPGMVEEYRAWARPWGFSIADVTVPTVVWQGTDDTLVPMRWGEVLAQRIPDARLSMREGEGHFLGYSHPVEILADLI